MKGISKYFSMVFRLAPKNLWSNRERKHPPSGIVNNLWIFLGNTLTKPCFHRDRWGHLYFDNWIPADGGWYRLCRDPARCNAGSEATPGWDSRVRNVGQTAALDSVVAEMPPNSPEYLVWWQKCHQMAPFWSQQVKNSAFGIIMEPRPFKNRSWHHNWGQIHYKWRFSMKQTSITGALLWDFNPGRSPPYKYINNYLYQLKKRTLSIS